MSERPPAEYFGRALASARAERGLKRMQLKEASGLSYPYIAELENGGKFPSQKALQALADALEMSPSELLARAEAIESAAPSMQYATIERPATTPPAATSPEPDVVAATIERVMAAVEPRLREWLRMEVTLTVEEELRRRGELR